MVYSTTFSSPVFSDGGCVYLILTNSTLFTNEFKECGTFLSGLILLHKGQDVFDVSDVGKSSEFRESGRLSLEGADQMVTVVNTATALIHEGKS